MGRKKLLGGGPVVDHAGPLIPNPAVALPGSRERLLDLEELRLAEVL